MSKENYNSMPEKFRVNRRDFLKTSGVAGAGIMLGTPTLWAQNNNEKNERAKTNIDDALKAPRTKYALPGLFPGRVIETHDNKAMIDEKPNAEVIKTMFEKGLQSLTGKNMSESFDLFFDENDVVGIKVNPVGAGLISTRLELVDAIIGWLTAYGLPKQNIIIWDRFDYMLTDAGYTTERFPGIGIEGLQTMDEAAMDENANDDSRWLDKNGNHVSLDKFDKDIYYWADVEAPQDKNYLNQHVVNNKYSYFGNLITKKLTKIINVPVFKNTGNGVSMATKNIGYGAVCNTGRLHRPLFFDVCTEVSAFPVIRDKMVLNITDGLRAQYDGGPMPNAQFAYIYNRLFFASDPFALDMICHNLLLQKRKQMQVKVNEHPRYTEYLRYAQKLGLGVADPEKIDYRKV